MKNQLPPSCPMLKADYESYCPAPSYGPHSFQETGKCSKQEECTKVVKDLRKMGAKTTSQINRAFK